MSAASNGLDRKAKDAASGSYARQLARHDCPPTMGGSARIGQSLADSARAGSLPLAYWQISGRMPGRTPAG